MIKPSSKKTECSYRSIDGTYTSKNTPEMPVPVPLMDLYGHLTQQGRSRAGLEGVDEDVEEHQAGGDEFGAGAE